jgi:predicted GNAT family N-acyltransferase
MSFSSEITDSFIKIKNPTGKTIANLYYMQFNRKQVLSNRFKNLELKPPLVLVNRLFVEYGYRRCGLATEMMQTMISKFSDIKQFIVVANPDEESIINRTKLIEFYSSFGFKTVSEIDEGTVMVLNR